MKILILIIIFLSCYSKPSPDAMNEYNKKVEFLKGLIETENGETGINVLKF